MIESVVTSMQPYHRKRLPLTELDGYIPVSIEWFDGQCYTLWKSLSLDHLPVVEHATMQIDLDVSVLDQADEMLIRFDDAAEYISRYASNVALPVSADISLFGLDSDIVKSLGTHLHQDAELSQYCLQEKLKPCSLINLSVLPEITRLTRSFSEALCRNTVTGMVGIISQYMLKHGYYPVFNFDFGKISVFDWCVDAGVGRRFIAYSAQPEASVVTGVFSHPLFDSACITEDNGKQVNLNTRLNFGLVKALCLNADEYHGYLCRLWQKSAASESGLKIKYINNDDLLQCRATSELIFDSGDCFDNLDSSAQNTIEQYVAKQVAAICSASYSDVQQLPESAGQIEDAHVFS